MEEDEKLFEGWVKSWLEYARDYDAQLRKLSVNEVLLIVMQHHQTYFATLSEKNGNGKG